LEVIIVSGANKARYSSRIEEITNQHLYLAMPMDKGVPIFLLPGTEIQGRVIVNSTVWEFTTKYVDKLAQPILMWLVEKPEEFVKIQMRDFVRFQTALPMTVRLLDDSGQEGEPLAVTTKDISGGGLLIIARQTIGKDSNLKLTLELPETGCIEANGVVVREDLLLELKVYRIAIKFTDIKERSRELLIKYIFKRQSRARRQE